jgi:hypothetical protein
MGLYFSGVAQPRMGNELTRSQRPQGGIQRVQLLRLCHHQQMSTLQIGFSQQPTGMVLLVGDVEMKNDFGHDHPRGCEMRLRSQVFLMRLAGALWTAGADSLAASFIRYCNNSGTGRPVEPLAAPLFQAVPAMSR